MHQRVSIITKVAHLKVPPRVVRDQMERAQCRGLPWERYRFSLDALAPKLA